MRTADVVRIIGNAPTAAEGISRSFDGIYLGLNSAPCAFVDAGIDCHACWVQDWRFFTEKRHLLKQADAVVRRCHLYVPDHIDTYRLPFASKTIVPTLGRHGFSFSPDVGVFEGYTAAYGALQLAQRFEPKVIELYGVDFSYSLTEGRFYQRRPGWDLDLHVHGRQIVNVRDAIEHLSDRGIRVDVKTPSLIHDLIDGRSLAAPPSRDRA